MADCAGDTSPTLLRRAGERSSNRAATLALLGLVKSRVAVRCSEKEQMREVARAVLATTRARVAARCLAQTVLANVASTVAAKVAAAGDELRELDIARQELGSLRAELEDARDQLSQRDKQLSDLSEHLAELEALHDRFKDEVQREMEKQRAEYETICGREVEARKAAEVAKENAEAHAFGLQERARAEANYELRAPRELADSNGLCQGLQGRLGDGAQQLERAQAAYQEAVEEISELSAKLYELEYINRDLQEKAERRQRQAEEAESTAQALRSQLEALQSQSSADTSGAKAQAAEEVRSLKEDMQLLMKTHQEQRQKSAQDQLDQVVYLRNKCEEKDRQILELLSERSVPKSPSKKVQELFDIEEGVGKGLALVDSPHPRSIVCFTNGDKLLKGFTRVLHWSSAARAFFFGYFCIMHIFIVVVLHNAAAAPILQLPG